MSPIRRSCWTKISVATMPRTEQKRNLC